MSKYNFDYDKAEEKEKEKEKEKNDKTKKSAGDIILVVLQVFLSIIMAIAHL